MRRASHVCTSCELLGFQKQFLMLSNRGNSSGDNDVIDTSGGKFRNGNGDGKDDDVVTPWNVSATGVRGVNYDRVLVRFKSQPIGEPLLKRMQDVCVERVKCNNSERGHNAERSAVGEEVQPLHHFFRRGIAFSHRDFDIALTNVQEALRSGTQGAYLYTGRGPSTRTMHLGHVIPFMLTRYLQDALGLPLVIQITDDEKFFFRDVPLHDNRCSDGIDIVTENIKDIIAFGFDPKRTFIFRNTSYMGSMYPTVVRLQRTMTLSAVKNTLGLIDNDNIGKASFAATQAAPCFSSSFPCILGEQDFEKPLQCIVPCAIDQDPYFVLARASASRMKYRAPALLHTKFLPALKGMRLKMSSSAEESGVITLHDSPEQVQKKMKKAFSGGSGTLDDMKTKGVDLEADVAYQFIRFFSPDDEMVGEVSAKYVVGEMNSCYVKSLAADVVVRHVLRNWQAKRKLVTDEEVRRFTEVRNIMA
ncbi:tryptophanyl-tRNA synthetase, putative [Trypanosoma brucei brucei TREU927]|uniref:tryptophan--tRNA ligase n=1 Tax=Trypanosoma brucei brucei (strain 927/4 GUTat10.1) TaxID=185431 RepID=Q581V8_TRYB2|nr:tryptophanyl-tRNA synthetase, putative [Trypanosoma brucei brucei TREU927]AAX79445.1 tryptophanyl-tRNA synthetase, putative [Trypanosoma brucei]AAZ12991.1 tryptophanyl-tRNA synthetase, putative [Trypanosoma brucei brucei TREU927]